MWKRFFLLAILHVIFIIFTPAPDSQAAQPSRIIYPPNKTSVDLATISIIGIVPETGHLPRITLNRGGIIPTVDSFRLQSEWGRAPRLRP